MEKLGGTPYVTSYVYNRVGQTGETKAGNTKEQYLYDAFGRLDSWDTYYGSASTPLIRKEISYKESTAKSTSDLVSKWSYSTDSYNALYNYSYDANGNIVTETVNGKTTTYVYDSANQLIRENNQAAGKTWVWTYDDAGNILSKTEYVYTTGAPGNVEESFTYTYGNTEWGDLLTKYNGVTITYDAIGNPLFDGIWTYNWQEGRKLASMSRGSTIWAYTYDGNGMRIARSSNTSSYRYQYTYHGTQLSHMTYGNHVMHFYYDASGRPLSVVYNGTTYYYVLNLQGDVVAILDTTGAEVVGYSYDAWGNPLDTTGSMKLSLGLYNPLRYRGYVYDQETGLYYLQSRYYNPEMGRFLNADSLVSTGQGLLGYNMFAYCNNNPINYSDESGHSLDGVFTQFGISLLMYIGIHVAAIFDEDIREDMNAIGWNPFNDDESKVMGSGKVSFYKGVPVIRTDFERSGSFGIIFLNDCYEADELRHERGHNTQLMMMGVGIFGFTVGIPSPAKLGKWNKENNYFGAPWETMPDLLGGVKEREHSDAEIKNAWGYHWVSMFAFPCTVLYWFSFDKRR